MSKSISKLSRSPQVFWNRGSRMKELYLHLSWVYLYERNCAIKCDRVTWKNKKERVRAELGYLRSPPALSAGPHMENQVSGPLGTDVCSPLDSSQSATEAVQEPGPLTTPYSHKSFTPGTEGVELWSSGETQTSKRQGKALSRSC